MIPVIVIAEKKNSQQGRIVPRKNVIMFEVYSTVAYHACVFRGVVFPFNIISVTAFDLFTFFRADLIQSEASWKLSSTSDWLMSV